MQPKQRLGVVFMGVALASLLTLPFDAYAPRLAGMCVFLVTYTLGAIYIVPRLDPKDAHSPYYQNHQPVKRYGNVTNVFVALYISHIFGVYDVGAWRHLLLIGVAGGLILQQRAVKRATRYIQDQT